MEKKTHMRVRLRAMEPEDLDMLYHIENDRSLWNVSARMFLTVATHCITILLMRRTISISTDKCD